MGNEHNQVRLYFAPESCTREHMRWLRDNLRARGIFLMPEGETNHSLTNGEDYEQMTPTSYELKWNPTQIGFGTFSTNLDPETLDRHIQNELPGGDWIAWYNSMLSRAMQVKPGSHIMAYQRTFTGEAGIQRVQKTFFLFEPGELMDLT